MLFRSGNLDLSLAQSYKCIDDLLAYNANTWFKQENSQRMLRTLDGSARAYLSNRYRRIANIDIAGVTLPILGGLPDIRFESGQITESRMYIKGVNPRLQAEVSPGDIVQACLLYTSHTKSTVDNHKIIIILYLVVVNGGFCMGSCTMITTRLQLYSCLLYTSLHIRKKMCMNAKILCASCPAQRIKKQYWL